MLISLHIENIAVIKTADIDFTAGFTVLTGETGAGKSIIIDSIALILGAKQSKELIRSGEETAMVSALFGDMNIRALNELSALGLAPDEDGMILLSRTISTSGKSTARMNGRAIPMSLLKDVAKHLIAIHGQHDNMTLLDPEKHLGFLDAYGGGHFAAQKDLLYKLVMDAPEAIQWLSGLGVEFDKAPDGTMITTHGGGTSRKRMHAAKDYSGAEIMRTLRDEVLNRGIPVVDFTSAVELIKDENGRCAGAVLLNMETKELLVAKAKTVILATGGAGRLHYQGFPTSNHYGATADGLVLGYRAGAKLLYPDTLQYHPTGAAYPAQIYGALVTEKVRSVGAMLVNADGEVFMNPLETRDVAAASIIRECTERGKGVKTPAGQAVWLDTPMIELKNGAGTIEKRIPAMMRMFAKHGIDIRKEPILVYPTLHYQNGGLHITADGQTDVENLFAAGEVVGGIHGRNRLMGNSLLDVIVFGRNAGQHAAEKAKSVSVGTLTLNHVAAFEAEKQQAGVADHRLSPQLLPDYARKIHPAEK